MVIAERLRRHCLALAVVLAVSAGTLPGSAAADSGEKGEDVNFGVGVQWRDGQDNLPGVQMLHVRLWMGRQVTSSVQVRLLVGGGASYLNVTGLEIKRTVWALAGDAALVLAWWPLREGAKKYFFVYGGPAYSFYRNRLGDSEYTRHEILTSGGMGFEVKNLHISLDLAQVAAQDDDKLKLTYHPRLSALYVHRW